MDKRQEELLQLRSYTEEIDKDLTMILQSLQWDRKHILQHSPMVTCKYDPNHKILHDKVEEHEQECLLRHNGYTKEECFLPAPLDTESSTLIKLSKEEIAHIINNASKSDPTFKKGVGSGDLEPQTLERLQCSYSSDERRAIHDAVVSAAPSCHDLADLALTSVGEDDQATKTKTRTEILAELRDMRRRRTKYRVAAKSRNYSDVLRDVIKTQMELYNDVLEDTKSNVNEVEATTIHTRSDRNDDRHAMQDDTDRYERTREHTKHESKEKDRDHSKRERSERYKKESRQENKNSRNRESYRERRRQSRHENDYRHRDESTDKHETKDRSNRDRSREAKHRDKSEEREYDERGDRKYKRRERSEEFKQEKSKRDYQQENTQRRYKEEFSRSKHSRERDTEQNKRRDECRDVSDQDRARNLLNEIKKEVESTEYSVDRGDCKYDGSIEINEERGYRDYISKDNGHQRHDRHKKKDNRERDHQNTERDFEDRVVDRSRDHKRHKERERSSSRDRRKHKKAKEDKRNRKESNKDGERSRTEDKHKIYYEIYSEIDSRRNKN